MFTDGCDCKLMWAGVLGCLLIARSIAQEWVCVHGCSREGARFPSALLKQKHASPRPEEPQATGLFPMLTCLRGNYRDVDLKLRKGELSSRRLCL